MTVKLVTVKRTFLYTFFFFFFLLGFRLIKGVHTCRQEGREWLTLLTYIRDTPTSGPGELPRSHRFCMHAQIVQSSLQTHTVWASIRPQHRQTGGKSLLYNLIKHFQWSFLCWLFLLIDTSMGPHCLSAAVTGFPCTPYGPLCMLCEAKALSTTIWLKKDNTDWPHFRFNAVGTSD